MKHIAKFIAAAVCAVMMTGCGMPLVEPCDFDYDQSCERFYKQGAAKVLHPEMLRAQTAFSAAKYVRTEEITRRAIPVAEKTLGLGHPITLQLKRLNQKAREKQ